jgi:hypothetical protein
MPATLVTLAQFKAHLRVTTPPGHVDDPDLMLKLDAAEYAIREYLSPYPADAAIVAGWDPTTVPPLVQGIILFQAAEYVRYRGDDERGPDRALERGDLHPLVVGALRRLRTPVIA